MHPYINKHIVRIEAIFAGNQRLWAKMVMNVFLILVIIDASGFRANASEITLPLNVEIGQNPKRDVPPDSTVYVNAGALVGVP